ncbi:hypothetical protein V6N13_141958 [Hibiscus sabdariffa]|uniref:Uncharacterized protein n=1 Tax=Hibiscus sabdariffa TaxID=183260 RepID=A0ABR2FCL9_9ROSI
MESVPTLLLLRIVWLSRLVVLLLMRFPRVVRNLVLLLIYLLSMRIFQFMKASRTSSIHLPMGEFQLVGEVHGADMSEGSLPHEGSPDPGNHAIDPNHIDTCV